MGGASVTSLLYAVAVIMLAVGVFNALVGGNAVKRTMGLLAAHVAAAALIVVLGASALAGLAVVMLASGLGVTALAAALSARIEEAYGAADAAALSSDEEPTRRDGEAE